MKSAVAAVKAVTLDRNADKTKKDSAKAAAAKAQKRYLALKEQVKMDEDKAKQMLAE